MWFPAEVKQVRITKDNIDQFKIIDKRVDNIDYINDRKALEVKLANYEKGIIDELTKVYPERYDLTVLTYNQYFDPYVIIDGCHRIEAMRKVLLPEGIIDGFTFWLIPSNTWAEPNGDMTEDEAVRLRDMCDENLKKAGLPKWVNKFYHTNIDGNLVAWKNINIIDTGDINQPLQFGVDWKLNQNGWNFAEGKELKNLPKWKDLIK
jgi:hypothetical protein